MDGIRSYYARTEGDSVFAAYSAVMAMSVRANLNLASLSFLADLALHGNLEWTRGLADHKVALVSFLILVAVANYILARVTGVYQRRGAAAISNWQRPLKIYLFFTVILFLLSVSMVWIRRPAGI